MRVIGYMPLHYGKEYLRESLLSVVDLVDKFVVLYTPSPSYGYNSSINCPDTEVELREIAESVLGDKLTWSSRIYSNEGEHRNEIYKYAFGFDLILTVDADEIVDTEEMKSALRKAYEGSYRNYGVNGYINLWRSFNYACFDGFLPVRVININNQNKELGSLDVTIWHFSCCQSNEVMDYKYEIHGHKKELRDDWLNSFYYSGRTKDVHPVAIGLWNAIAYDKNKMPDSLRKHVNFEK